MNEVSNGPSGNMEYVEFVVVDTNVIYNCAGVTNPPCIDIRGWIFDDNSGYHGAGGVAPGCIRFSNNPFWSCIPVGTILLLYNELDPNINLPAIDTLMTDGNCRIVVPVDKVNWFERNVTTPGAAACSYPVAGWLAAGTWSSTLFANTGDCARIVNLAGCEVFSVCWGTDNLNNLIYFAGSAQDRVYFFNNSLSNDATNNANWTNGCADPGACGLNQQTPGVPNNVANANWINGMNNNCTPIQPLSVISNTISGSCPCTASASVSITGSLPPFSYTWTPAPGSGQGTPNAGGLCTGTYSCIVKSNITKCTQTVIVNVSNNNTLTTSAGNTGSYCAGSTIQLNTPVANSYSWNGPGGFSSSVQNPTIATGTPTMSGTYTVQVSVGTCTAEATTSLTVNALPLVTVSNNGPVCAGQQLVLNGGSGMGYMWNGPLGFTSTAQNPTIAVSSASNSGTYTLIVTGANTCTNSAITNSTINPLPVATASNNGPICIGNALNLNSGGGGSYLWAGPNSFTSTVQNPTIVSTNTINSGLYTVTVTLASCTAVASTSVIVTTATASANSTGPYCEGAAIQMNASLGTSFSWTGPGGFVSSSQSPSIAVSTPTMSGIYSVTVSIGTCTANATTSITVNTIPVVSVSNNGPVCEGQLILLNGSGSGSYSWSGPSGFSSFAQNPTIAVSSTSNSGTYTLVVTTANTCTNIAVTNVTVNPLPVVVASGSDACVGETFNLASSGGITYSWAGPNGFASSNQNPSISIAVISNSGIYTVVATSTNNCASSATITVNINLLPTVTIGGTDVCAGSLLNLTAAGGSNYLWNGPNGFTSANQNASINNVALINSGIYTVTVSNGNCTNSATINININSLPNVTASANNLVLCSDSTAFIFSSGGIVYNWTGPAGFNSSLQNPVISNLSESNEGIYFVTSGDAKNCVSTASLLITIDICRCTPFVPEGFSPNGDGAHDTFFITCIEGRKTKIEIYNRWGNLVYKDDNYNNTWNGKTNSGFQVSGEDLPAGTYYYIVNVDDEDKARTGYTTLWR